MSKRKPQPGGAPRARTLKPYRTPRTGVRTINTLDDLLAILPRPEDPSTHFILPDYRLTAKGNFASVQPPTLPNVQYVLDRIGIDVRLNMMNKKTEFIFPHNTVVDPSIAMSAVEMVMEWARIREAQGLRETLKSLAVLNRYHPAENWVLSQKWDKRDHFSQLIDSLPTDQAKEAGLYLWRFFVQMVECARGWRSLVPTQKDLVPVFVGAQGLYKTSWIRHLVPKDYVLTGASLNLDGYASRDSMHQVLIYWLVELGELETTFQRSAQGHLKNFISRSEDVYRLAYARNEISWPRSSAFFSTVNLFQFLRDATGSRRFLPIYITGHLPDPRQVVNTQQLFAQANAAWEAGEQWHLTAKEEQIRGVNEEEFEESNEIEDLLNEYFGERIQRSNSDAWLPMTYAQIARCCEFNGTNANVHRVTMWLAKQGVKRTNQITVQFEGRRISGRKCWVLPVAPRDVSRLYSDVDRTTYEKLLGQKMKVVK